jgi:hypothetical protein
MILVLGAWAFVRALLVNSAAVSLENVAPRHQLSVLQRSVRRPRFRRRDAPNRALHHFQRYICADHGTGGADHRQ